VLCCVVLCVAFVVSSPGALSCAPGRWSEALVSLCSPQASGPPHNAERTDKRVRGPLPGRVRPTIGVLCGVPGAAPAWSRGPHRDTGSFVCCLWRRGYWSEPSEPQMGGGPVVVGHSTTELAFGAKMAARGR
jgi:hypothetical protein